MSTDAEARRQPYLQMLLAALEEGRIGPDRYCSCVTAVNAATTTEQMAAAAGPVLRSGRGADAVPARPLDAVDLALLRAAQSARPARPVHRYLGLAVVLVLFVVLAVMGVWLAARVHASPSGVTSGLVAMATPVATSVGRGVPYPV